MKNKPTPQLTVELVELKRKTIAYRRMIRLVAAASQCKLSEQHKHLKEKLNNKENE